MDDIETFVKTIAMLFLGMFCGLAMAKKHDRRRNVPAEYSGVERRKSMQS
ncbi:MAG: hypothetical protein HY919_04575 [Elusimicrobia bacterium]|nr:hypothetical protein [Elusimicrobiota bacterium]